MSDWELAAETKQLATAFDELVSQVTQRVQQLAKQASDVCMEDMATAEEDVLKRANQEISALQSVLADCDRLESQIVQLEGIKQITGSLRQVVHDLDQKLS